MGAWGTGNFENDTALDFVSSTLTAQLRRAIENPTLADPRGWESDQLFAAVEILAVVYEAIDIDPLPTRVVERCREVCIREFDAHIDARDPDPEYKHGRRNVIAATFERLLAVCRRRDQANRARTESPPQPPIRLQGQTTFPSHWLVLPEDEQSYLSLDEVEDRLKVTFPDHEFNEEVGRAFAAGRLAELAAAGDAPEVLLRLYGGDPPVLVRLANAQLAPGRLDFYLWPNREIGISFESASQEQDCLPLLECLAMTLGYGVVDDT